jgi:hypothetical protein
MPRPLLSDARLAMIVFTVRGERVILDEDVASLYGVQTRALNQAVKRNTGRFPNDFMFQLTSDEWASAKEQAAAKEASGMRSQIVTSYHRKISALPFAFTEQGVAMLSSVLNSRRAIEVNIAIMRTFVQLRRLMDSNRELARKIEAMEKNYDEQFAVVFEAIRQLVADDQVRNALPKRRIGF